MLPGIFQTQQRCICAAKLRMPVRYSVHPTFACGGPSSTPLCLNDSMESSRWASFRASGVGISLSGLILLSFGTTHNHLCLRVVCAFMCLVCGSKYPTKFAVDSSRVKPRSSRLDLILEKKTSRRLVLEKKTSRRLVRGEN